MERNQEDDDLDKLRSKLEWWILLYYSVNLNLLIFKAIQTYDTTKNDNLDSNSFNDINNDIVKQSMNKEKYRGGNYLKVYEMEIPSNLLNKLILLSFKLITFSHR